MLSTPQIESIEDLIEPAYLQKIRDTFARSTGIEVILGRLEPGEFLTEPKWYAFCAQLQQRERFNQRCFDSYLSMIEQAAVQDEILISTCHLGLLMFGAPLRLDDRVLGMMGGCMVRPNSQHLSREDCEHIGQQYECAADADELRRALDQMPIYTEQQLGSTLAIFREMANALSEVAKRQYLLNIEQAKRATLSRYFSPNIFPLLEAAEQSLEYQGEATVLFADMRNFTARSERLSPAHVVELLNEYFEEMVAAVFEFDGTLDKFIGDALLAVFGAPIPAPHGPWRAVQAAFRMLERLEQLNGRRSERGQDAIDMGIGIHTGAVVGGNIGSAQRLEYTVVGDTVNVASRIQALTKNGAENVLVSDATYQAVRDRVVVVGQQQLQLRGKSKPTLIYRLAGLR